MGVTQNKMDSPLAMIQRTRQRRKLLLLLLLLRRRWMKKRVRSSWIREIFHTRTEMGEYHALISEMRFVDHESFYRYFHMTPSRFDSLLSLVGPLITL